MAAFCGLRRKSYVAAEVRECGALTLGWICAKGRQLKMFSVFFPFFRRWAAAKNEQKRTLSIAREWSSFVYKWKNIIQSLRQDDCNKSVRKLLGFIYSDTHREPTFFMLFISVRFSHFSLLSSSSSPSFNVSECWERPAGFASCIITSTWNRIELHNTTSS